MTASYHFYFYKSAFSQIVYLGIMHIGVIGIQKKMTEPADDLSQVVWRASSQRRPLM